jgi:hypothetical protein
MLHPPPPVPRPQTPVLKIAILSLLFPFTLLSQIPYLPGWPVAAQSPTGRPICIADINDDGIKELLMMAIGNNFQNDMLYAFARDGMVLPGYPIAEGQFFSGDPALFDFNDDGKLESVVPQNGNLYLRNQQGNAVWAVPYSGPIFQSTYYPFHVSVGDINGDGENEIIVTCYAGGAVFVFDAQGNVRPGWPVIIPPPSGYSPPQMYNSASLGDIDNDGLKEILVGVDNGGPAVGPSQVFCFKPDGSSCPGFPVGVSWQGYRSKAVLLDIDGDGYLEIIIGKEKTELNVYRHDGSLFPGYPIPEGVRGFAVGDLDKNQSMDMVFSRYGLRGFNLAGASALPNFPFTDPSGQFGFSDKAPNICELGDDPGLEIAAGASNATGTLGDGKLFAFNLQGQVVSGFPSALLYHRELLVGCAVNDVDGNGATDICCGSQNNENVVPKSSTVFCWDTGYLYNLDNVDWAMDGFDLGHTGRWRRLYHISKSGSQLTVDGCTDANPCYLPRDGSLIPVTVTAVRQFGGANPGGQDVRYSRTLGCGNYEGPVIDHGDGTYTRMLRAPTAECTTDIHAWVNEFKLSDYQTVIFHTPMPKEASPAGTPMTAEKGPGDSVMVHYTAGCGATSHSVYWGSGPIGAALNWSDAACDVPCDGTFDPGDPAPGEWTYFVVVGQNSTLEGSYGTNSQGQQRPEAVGIGFCDKPQDLTGTCP